MDIEQSKATIEAVLFTMGDAVELSALAAAIEHDEETTRKMVELVAEDYRERKSGLQIVRFEDSYQMCTAPEHFAALVRVATQPRKLSFSDAALETLSVIAYRQPITRLEMEKIRGVGCAHQVDRLLDYGLVEEVGRLEAPGRPILFGTTKEFLRVFGLASLEDLPRIGEEELQLLSNEAETEAGGPVAIEI